MLTFFLKEFNELSFEHAYLIYLSDGKIVGADELSHQTILQERKVAICVIYILYK